MAHGNPMPPVDLRGTTCLIAGGARGLGATVTRYLARCGVNLAVHYHQSAEAAQTLCAEAAALGVQAHPLRADISDADAAEALVAAAWQQFGTIDLFVNTVGPYADMPFMDMPLDTFDEIWNSNARAAFVLTRAVGRRMRQRGSGQIITIAATDYLHRSHSIYGLAKAGVVYLTEAFALELAPTVRVNAIAPDLIADNEDMGEAIAAPAIGGTPLGRLVTRAEIAQMVGLLCAPAFAAVTGQTIVMDGGRTLPRIAMGD